MTLCVSKFCVCTNWFAAGEDFTAVSRTLVFSSSRRGGNGFIVTIGIRDDVLLESTESFLIDLLLLGVEGEEENVRIVHPRAEVFIEDDDGG